jgi:hypothetical protein
MIAELSEAASQDSQKAQLNPEVPATGSGPVAGTKSKGKAKTRVIA